MAIETIPFEKLNESVEEIFEAVVVAAKRARQINQLRLLKYEIPRMQEEFEEFHSEMMEAEDYDFDKEKKVTTLALEELLDKKIKYTYVRKLEEEDLDFEVKI